MSDKSINEIKYQTHVVPKKSVDNFGPSQLEDVYKKLREHLNVMQNQSIIELYGVDPTYQLSLDMAMGPDRTTAMMFGPSREVLALQKCAGVCSFRSMRFFAQKRVIARYLRQMTFKERFDPRHSSSWFEWLWHVFSPDDCAIEEVETVIEPMSIL